VAGNAGNIEVNFVDLLFKSETFYLLPAPAYIVLYIIDVFVFIFGIRLIAKRTFPYSAYTYGFALLAFPDLLLYPTDRSEINVYAMNEYYYHRYMGVIDKAFVLTSAGFFILVLSIKFGNRLTRHMALGFIGRSIRTAIFSTSFANIMVLLQGFLLILMIATGVKLFSARQTGFQDTSLRPITVVGTYLSTFCLTIFFAKLFFKRNLKSTIYLSTSVLFGLTLGARSAIFEPLLFFVFYYAWWTGNKNILKYIVYVIVLLVLVHLADVLRTTTHSSGGLSENSFIASVLYGNSFSDLRDFALIISGFSSLFWGKTYVAGLLGFIPSFLFPLRQEWNLGPTTLQLSGLYLVDPEHLHPGLRGTYISEPYINFGLAGILAISLLLGVFFLYDYVGVREAVQRRDKADFIVRIVRYEIVFGFVSLLYNTSGLSYGYFVLAMLTLAAALKKI